MGVRARSLVPWVPLLHGADELGIIAEWLRLAAAEPDDRRRSEYGGLAKVFAGVTAERQRLWSEVLKEWNVKQSQAVLEWLAEGEAKGRIEMLLDILATRFGPLPPEVVAAIRQTTSDDRLRALGVAAGTAATFEAFRQQAGL
jgi:hypothetical protein